jgi:tRNA(adenine34) deaminase
MEIALTLAEEAAAEGEVPVGCVIVRGNEILAKGRNRREALKNALAHAEIEAIDAACRALGGWRLSGCTLYVTLEPCPMCAGAIVNARIPRVVYGAKDARAGAMGSLLNVNAYPLNHHASVTPGVLGDRCARILREFFLSRRGR